MKKLNVGLVGLQFGGNFAEIYKAHPNVGRVVLFDPDRNQANRIAAKAGGCEVVTSYEDILKDRDIDAVHIVSPVPYHEEQALAALNAGKHCASTIPMALSLEGLQRITDAVRRSGKNYMVMETTLYTYQYFYASEMKKNGEFGKIQFLRGTHYQDFDKWPDYWQGFPPMWHISHALSPMVMLADSRVSRVVCFGSGTMDEALTKVYGNPFPLESGLFEFENGLKGEVTRSQFEVARAYQEGMFIYGSEKSFEWGFRDRDNPYITVLQQVKPGERGRRTIVEQTPMPNHYQSLPEELWKFTIDGDFDPLNPQVSLSKVSHGGHHGSHPHMVHEFLSSIIEERKPWIDVTFGANVCAAGICAHQSAMENGRSIIVPTF